jgi:hypothetical protein
MIQYSEAFVIKPRGRGVLDTRVRGYDGLLWNCRGAILAARPTQPGARPQTI